MSKNLNLKYKKMFNGLKEIINSWDLYKLIEGGASEDEFDAEIAKVLSGLSKCTSSDNVVELVAEVFGESFENKEFSFESSKLVGEKIYLWYKDF